MTILKVPEELSKVAREKGYELKETKHKDGFFVFSPLKGNRPLYDPYIHYFNDISQFTPGIIESILYSKLVVTNYGGYPPTSAYKRQESNPQKGENVMATKNKGKVVSEAELRKAHEIMERPEVKKNLRKAKKVKGEKKMKERRSGEDRRKATTTELSPHAKRTRADKAEPVKKEEKKLSRYGHRLGSARALMDEAFFKGTTIEEMEKAGVRAGRVRRYAKFLEETAGVTVKITERTGRVKIVRAK